MDILSYPKRYPFISKKISFHIHKQYLWDILNWGISQDISRYVRISQDIFLGRTPRWRQIPRGVCVGVRAWVPVLGGGGVVWIALHLGACPECFAHASAEDQPPSEAIAAAAPAPAPVPRRSQRHYSGITETFDIVYWNFQYSLLKLSI